MLRIKECPMAGLGISTKHATAISLLALLSRTSVSRPSRPPYSCIAIVESTFNMVGTVLELRDGLRY